MKLYKNMEKIEVIAIETLYYLMNMNIPASHVVIMLINENTNSQKFSVRKLIL